MAKRKDENFQVRRQQIIDGALQVFAAQGFARASNRAIAQAAGIGSPGLIYHYFRDKGHLYQEVLEQRVPVLQLLSRPEEMAGLELEEVLLRFARAYLKVLDAPQAVALVRLVMGDSFRDREVAGFFWEAGPARGFLFLSGYLRSAMEGGQLRPMEPTQAVVQFMGPLVVFLMSRVVFEASPLVQFDREEFVATHVQHYLRGLKPTENTRLPDPV